MDKNYKILKAKALLLRQRGFSYNEINRDIKVSKSVDLNYKISSWIDLIVDSLKPKIKLVQKKWCSLETPRPINL